MHARKSELPSEFRIGKSLGKGANNEVLDVTSTVTGVTHVLRRPLKRSDTRSRSGALKEAKMTELLSELNVAPRLIDMWYVQNTTTVCRKGLYMISEKYDMDFATLLEKHAHKLLQHTSQIRSQLVAMTKKMAHIGVFCIDVKPSNTVCRVRILENGDIPAPPELRFIDFGCDYCETVDEPGNVLAPFFKEAAEMNVPAEQTADALFVGMLVMYSAHMHMSIRSTDHDLRPEHVWALNILHPVVKSICRNAQPNALVLYKSLLSQRDVRKTFEHYFKIHKDHAVDVCLRRGGFRMNG